MKPANEIVREAMGRQCPACMKQKGMCEACAVTMVIFAQADAKRDVAMGVRDMFASSALMGLVGKCDVAKAKTERDIDMACEAYTIADYMMKRREMK